VDWEIIAVISCLVFSAAFSGFEMALTSLGRLELQKIVARGDSASRQIQRWVRDPGRVLITILVGNNIANFVGSSVFTLWLTHQYPMHVSWAIAAMSITFIVFAEIMPKLMARYAATSVAPYAMRFLTVTGWILLPLTWLINKLTSGLVMLSGMPGRQGREPVSEEDITHTIEIATKDGGIDRATGEVLSNLIEFPDRLTMHVMTPRSKLAAISVAWSWDQVLRYVAVDGHSRYPVYNNNLDNIVGILLVKDLFREIQKPSAASWTRRIRRPYYVSEMVPLGSVLREMKRWGTHMALVRNEAGVVTGLVTMEDLLEEIVGDIRDEHDDPSEADYEQALGGPRIVNGEIPIVDFNDRYDHSLPVDSSYGTLNGYLLMRTGGQLPPPGTLIFDDDMTFRIHSVSDTGIATVELIEISRSVSADDDQA
jgi:putative hemolysin